MVLTIIFLVVAIGGGVLAYLFHTRSRAMSITPTLKIDSANSGYVEFEGRAQPVSDSGTQSPLTNTPCLWFEYEITKQMSGRGSNSQGQWVNVDKSRSDAEFYLTDGTGKCIIDPKGAKVITSPMHTDRWLGHTARPTTMPEKRGSRFGLFPGQRFSSFDFGNGLWFSTRKDYRYTERHIPTNAPLYVIGQFSILDGGQNGTEMLVGALLREWKNDQKNLLSRFDADGDGQISIEEWEAARQAAEKEVARDSGMMGNNNSVSVLGATGDRNKPFIISAIPQAKLLSHYRLLTKVSAAASVFGSLMVLNFIAGRI